MATDDGPGAGRSAPSPFALAANTHREVLSATVDAVEKADMAAERVPDLTGVEVGATPSEVVYEENKLELLHYEPLTDERNDVPILIIYALINRPFILDLQPDRSVVRRLLEAGHDVYLIDWNEPSRLDQFLTLDDYVNRYVDNCVDAVRDRSGAEAINVLGYCMGGTMSAMYAALHPGKVNALGLLAAGLCFDDTGGVLELWGDEEFYDPETVTDTFGNMPAEMLEVGFALMDPVANFVAKYVRLYDNLEDDEFVANFARMERWLDEGIDVAGETYVQFLEDIYQDNKLYRNELEVGGERVDLAAIDMPLLQVVGEYDHLIPAESSEPFNEVVGSEDATTIRYPTGHIGLSVSSSTQRDVWPEAAEWFHRRSDLPRERREAIQAAVDDLGAIDVDVIGDGEDDGADEVGADTDADVEADADAADAEGTDVEAVDGIGPTYGERLREADLGTVGALAGADPATVADVTGAGESRARDWIDLARSGE